MGILNDIETTLKKGSETIEDTDDETAQHQIEFTF